jgi:hypothetical protein
MTEVVFAIVVICTVMAVSLVGVGENPPAAIEKAFKVNFKNASKVVWQATHSIYRAKFMINGVRHRVIYTKTGKLIFVKSAISLNELPHNTRVHFDKNFQKQTIREVFSVTQINGSKQYLVESNNIKAIYSEDGAFIKMEKKCTKMRALLGENEPIHFYGKSME